MFSNIDFTLRLVANLCEGVWKEAPIKVTKDDVPELGDMEVETVFRHKDILDFLVSEFGCAEYATPDFVLKPKIALNAHGERVYDGPETAYLWHYLQQLEQRDHKRVDVVIAAVQLYSDKTLLNMKGLQAHPVR